MGQNFNPNILVFEGVVASGVGNYSDMIIPGLQALENAPADWPEELQRGSLNIVIKKYPDTIQVPEKGKRLGVCQLDSGWFGPTFVIPGDKIKNNKLLVDNEPSDAQVWRATMLVPGRGQEISCWVVRRFESGVGKFNLFGNVLEIVSEDYLRVTYGLENDDAVTIRLFEGPD